VDNLLRLRSRGIGKHLVA